MKAFEPFFREDDVVKKITIVIMLRHTLNVKNNMLNLSKFTNDFL